MCLLRLHLARDAPDEQMRLRPGVSPRANAPHDLFAKRGMLLTAASAGVVASACVKDTTAARDERRRDTVCAARPPYGWRIGRRVLGSILLIPGLESERRE